MKLGLGFGVVLTCLAFIAAGQAQPQLKIVDGNIYITGLHSASSSLSVYTHEAFLKKINQPVAGKCTWRNDALVFEPAFPFANGGKYHAIVSGSELVFEIPAGEFSRTSIESVYPESTVVPENLLRMYVCFSNPMMPGEVYDHVKLFNEKGSLVEKAFLVVDQELWDSERKRLTILFDPGRIKRGLKSNLDLGTALKEGEKYRLVVDSLWRDVNGNYLENSFTKTLVVERAQRTKLQVKNLEVTAPTIASSEALTINFDRSIDHALVSKYLSVHDALTATVSGKFEVTDGATVKFTPDLPWQAGDYTLVISPLLEDVAGNNFNNVFDIDLLHETRVSSTELLKVPVSIKSLP